MAGTVVAYAVSADGYQSHRTELNDGGIWVTSNADGIFGRINKPIGQADGALFADADDNLDIVQQDAAVVGVNLTDNLLTSIDPSTVQPVEGEEATIPPGAQVVLAGETLAVLDPSDGRVWAQRIDRRAGLPSVGALADASDPLAEVGKAAALTVTASGAVLAASADERPAGAAATVWRWLRGGRGAAARARSRGLGLPHRGGGARRGARRRDRRTGRRRRGQCSAAAGLGRCSSPARAPARCWSRRAPSCSTSTSTPATRPPSPMT